MNFTKKRNFNFLFLTLFIFLCKINILSISATQTYLSRTASSNVEQLKEAINHYKDLLEDVKSKKYKEANNKHNNYRSDNKNNRYTIDNPLDLPLTQVQGALEKKIQALTNQIAQVENPPSNVPKIVSQPSNPPPTFSIINPNPPPSPEKPVLIMENPVSHVPTPPLPHQPEKPSFPVSQTVASLPIEEKSRNSVPSVPTSPLLSQSEKPTSIIENPISTFPPPVFQPGNFPRSILTINPTLPSENPEPSVPTAPPHILTTAPRLHHEAWISDINRIMQDVGQFKDRINQINQGVEQIKTQINQEEQFALSTENTLTQLKDSIANYFNQPSGQPAHSHPMTAALPENMGLSQRKPLESPSNPPTNPLKRRYEDSSPISFTPSEPSTPLEAYTHLKNMVEKGEDKAAILKKVTDFYYEAKLSNPPRTRPPLISGNLALIQKYLQDDTNKFLAYLDEGIKEANKKLRANEPPKKNEPDTDLPKSFKDRKGNVYHRDFSNKTNTPVYWFNKLRNYEAPHLTTEKDWKSGNQWLSIHVTFGGESASAPTVRCILNLNADSKYEIFSVKPTNGADRDQVNFAITIFDDFAAYISEIK